MKKLECLDGLRGFACLVVLTCHFATAFFPGGMNYSYPGVANVDILTTAHTKFIDNLNSMPVISFFSNGNLAVCIFFILSGIVLSRSYFYKNENTILARLNKRILRFYAPVSLSIIFSYIVFINNDGAHLLTGKATGSVWLSGFWNTQIPFNEAIKQILYEALFYGSSSLNPVVWTMKIELIGSMLLMSYLHLTAGTSGWVKTINLAGLTVLCIGAFDFQSIYYMLFFVGAAINITPKLKSPLILALIFMFGLYLGTYSNAYSYPQISNIGFYNNKAILNSIGALLIVYAIYCGFANRLLTSKFAIFLGNISFSLYLIHFPILMSFSSAFYLKTGNSMTWLGLNFITTLSLSIALAFLFYHLIDKRNINYLKTLAIVKTSHPNENKGMN